MCLAPQSVCHTERLNADLSPPCCFVPTSMQFAMMSTAQWDRELITHLRPLYLPAALFYRSTSATPICRRCRRFPTDDPARARHPQLHAGAAPLHPWHGKLDPIQYDRSARTTGTGNYPLARMVGLAFDTLSSLSVTPLWLASSLGLALGFLSLLMVGCTLGSWTLGHVVEGWTSLLTLVLILGST